MQPILLGRHLKFAAENGIKIRHVLISHHLRNLFYGHGCFGKILRCMIQTDVFYEVRKTGVQLLLHAAGNVFFCIAKGISHFFQGHCGIVFLYI